MSLLELEEVTRIVEAEPHAARALRFYALIKTLSTKTGGHAYSLLKLREFDEPDRRLCYGLMELMAQGANETPQWQTAVERMDAALRA